ncbi:biogenesis of lysosome-related organelles complex 1 subunit 3-like [Mizuhopecten yessoensis]|uniref:Biogenesis of lysosome-related organelles complex 1 subunit 3 n=1 Tax=Mizuhopecten yessoensis TaxID=6573 RepID=A0A210QD16_MIZYE|nr:biogenesis of lysosome-related organelles complex 1 subunit 3-like [Mizuhopecten yessoensis]OWF46653.1 Biogenesis of lysosome-related organelles complex 1 subunit 3 [Mizuhopecten yessoensis]
MDTNVQTVVPGEASESDDDDVDATMTKNTTDSEQIATVVSGEASESEEDETDVPTNKQDKPELPPLKVDTNGKGDNDDITSGDRVSTPTSPTSRTADVYRPKYDTLLHRKLRERNNSLRHHMVDAVHQAYQTSTKDLHNTAQQLHKSQSVVMDISHNMRLLTNDLFYLEDKIDIITTCKILPDINIAVPGTETPGPST